MASTYSYTGAPDPLATGYQGGATGVESDYQLRQILAQMAAQAQSQGMNLATADQIQAAKGDLSGALGGYKNLMTNGMYSPDDENAILSNRVQQVNNTTQAMQQNLNAENASRGLGANAGASAALGMAGQFNAAGQRGQAYGDIKSQQAQSKVTGLQGYAGVSGTLAGYDAQATRQAPNTSAYMDLYNQFRNATIGPDGANFASSGAPAAGGYGGGPVATLTKGSVGTSGGFSPFTPVAASTAPQLPAKKKNPVFNYAY